MNSMADERSVNIGVQRSLTRSVQGSAGQDYNLLRWYARSGTRSTKSQQKRVTSSQACPLMHSNLLEQSAPIGQLKINCIGFSMSSSTKMLVVHVLIIQGIIWQLF